ncbi:MAG: TlpA family protein disulfide reductase [Treponema sp.]|nr:TlpA family protein disulfide reductase [Treponema sp.]
MTQKLKIVLGIAGLALLIGVAYFAYSAFNEKGESFNPIALAEERNANRQEQKAPDFSMTDWDGNMVKLSDFSGKPVVVNFWASWCPPCVEEMPDFNRVYRELGSEVHFLMVNLVDGQRETVEIAKRFITGNGFSFPVFFDTGREGSRAYGIRAIPTTLFINKDGNVSAIDRGMINENTLRRRIEQIR